MSARALDVFGAFVRLGDEGRADVTPQAFGGDALGWHVMAFHAETDADVHADHWEIHTAADELVVCLRGGMRMYMRPEEAGATEDETVVGAGRAVVVPRGRWHRIELDGATDLISITVPSGSRLEARS